MEYYPSTWKELTIHKSYKNSLNDEIRMKTIIHYILLYLPLF